MSETPPPRDPDVPPDDKTLIANDWAVRPEGRVVVEQSETDTVPPRRPLIWPWLLALLLLVLGGLGALYYFTQKDEKTVPAVVGLRQERAEAAVRDAGLDPETTRQESSKPRGIVFEQSPSAGTKLDEGDAVRLVVSNGPPRETVPDVVGETEAAATADLTAAGFKAEVTRAFSDKKVGIVASQDPDAGANLKEGSSVALTVSKGSKPVTVPDVVGTTSSEATATLRDAGLKANVVGVPSDRPSGTVVAQNPVAGKQAKSGATVRLNVAQAAGGSTSTSTSTTTAPPPATTAPTTTAPAQPATVPDVVGKELSEAAKAFADQGLKVAVQYVPSSEPQGRVIAQAQPAGTERKRGDTVQLNVSVGAQPAADMAVPDAVGQRLDAGRRALESAGFEVLALNLDGAVRNESPIGAQTPKGGANVPRGSLVILYVGA
jgi:beta-lactam-binding protein with PASTA domain